MTTTPLHVRIGPSRRLTGLLVLVHVAAWAVLYPLAFPATLKLALAAAIVASGVHSVLKTALLRSRHAIVALEIDNEGMKVRERGTGQWRACRVLGTTFVSNHLTVLNLELVKSGKIRHVVLLSDNVDRDDFRRLRVRLRWNKSTAADSAATGFFGRPAARISRQTVIDAGEE